MKRCNLWPGAPPRRTSGAALARQRTDAAARATARRRGIHAVAACVATPLRSLAMHRVFFPLGVVFRCRPLGGGPAVTLARFVHAHAGCGLRVAFFVARVLHNKKAATLACSLATGKTGR
jgi:hypothetical protein